MQSALLITVVVAIDILLAVWFIKLCIQHWPRRDGKPTFGAGEYFVGFYWVCTIGLIVWAWATGRL